jgi:hypothetical protein
MSKGMERRERDVVELDSKNVKLVGTEMCGLKKLWQTQLEILHDKTQKRKRFLFQDAPPPLTLRSELISTNMDIEETSYGKSVISIGNSNNVPYDRYLKGLYEQLK